MSRFPRPGRTPRPRPVPTAGPTPSPTPGPGTTFTLTTNIETLPSGGQVAGPNAVFNAPVATNVIGTVTNTLQSGDVLNGGGSANVLNATFAVTTETTAVPTINNIGTLNVTELTGNTVVNAALANGITTIGDINSVARVAVTGLTTVVGTLNKSGGIARNTTITAGANALAGAADSIQINLNGQLGGNIDLRSAAPSATNGYDTINISATGSNTIGRVTTGGSVDNFSVSGGSLTIAGTATNTTTGVDAIDSTIASFNASAMTGALVVGSVALGAGNESSVFAPGAQALSFQGSNNGTTLFIESGSLGATDTVNGGSGASDTLVLTSASNGTTANASVSGTTAQFRALGFENLSVRNASGGGNATAVSFDLTNVSGVNNIQLGGATSGADDVQTFQNLVYSAPVTVSVTGTGTSAGQTVNNANLGFTPISVFGTDNVVNYTFGNNGVGVGTGNAVTSAQLSADSIETLNFLFRDLSLDGAVGTNGSTISAASSAGIVGTANSARSVSVVSAGGSARTTGAINIGNVGGSTGTVASASIASAGAVTIGLNQAAGATVITSGAGNHTVTARVASNAIGINGSAGTGAQALAGNSGADIVIGGSGADTLTGAAGIDRLTGNAGIDTFVQSAASLGQSATSVGSTSFSTGTTLTFANNLDIVTDFVTTDLLDVVTAGSVSNAFGLDVTTSGAAVSGNNLFLRGEYDATTSVFTVGSSGADALVAPSGINTTFGANTSLILLDNIAANPVAANFV